MAPSGRTAPPGSTMTEFEERITQHSSPAIRLEHDVRYLAARPLVTGSDLWCDLGCGTGVAAISAVEGRFGGRVVLVDVVEAAVREATEQIEADEVETLRADLSSEEDLSLVREALLD